MSGRKPRPETAATTVLATVAYAVLLKPLPWPEPDRLVRLEERRGVPSGRLAVACFASAARGLMPEGNRTRPKSALPKDQRTASIYQHETEIALQGSGSFLSVWLDLEAVRELCRPERQLTESERALLFRVICLHHWRVAYNVREP